MTEDQYTEPDREEVTRAVLEHFKVTAAIIIIIISLVGPIYQRVCSSREGFLSVCPVL